MVLLAIDLLIVRTKADSDKDLELMVLRHQPLLN
jgi:hypothetical protein